MKSGVYIFAVFYLSFFVSIPLALSWNNDDVSDKINNSTTPNDIESMVSYGEGGQIQVMSGQHD